MSANRIVRTIITISIIAIVALLGVYMFWFWGNPISSDSSDFGAFGDYFGGILNPLIGIGNLLALIYISIFISKIEGNREEQQFLLQKEYALYTLKHESLKDISIILEKVQLVLIDRNNVRLQLILIRNEFNAYITLNSYLFPFFENRTWETLRDTIEEFAELDLENVDELINKLQTYNDLKIDFILEIQSEINL
jgi:hypothetical protein